MIFGYVRVSKGEQQNIDMQVEALKKCGVDKIIVEAASGSRWERPEMHNTKPHF
jgi:DNA invertase Pin-like site-specific DNA recombinase